MIKYSGYLLSPRKPIAVGEGPGLYVWRLVYQKFVDGLIFEIKEFS